MFEDGIYVNFVDEQKQKVRSVIVIKNGKAEIYAGPDADKPTTDYLSSLKKKLSSLSDEAYDDYLDISLDRYFGFNGYTPNPSDFFDSNSEKGKSFLEKVS